MPEPTKDASGAADPYEFADSADADNDVSDLHTRGEYVYGLGWSCVEDDTFYCPVVNASGDQEADEWGFGNTPESDRRHR